MMPKRVAIIMVTYNSKIFLRDALESILKQNFSDYSVLIIDNNSYDGTIEFVKKNYPMVYILKNFKNTGFSKANNQGIKITKSDYVLVMNPDVVLEKDFLEKIIFFADQKNESASFTGKIFKSYPENDLQKEKKDEDSSVKTEIIDTIGLEIHKNRSVNNIGEGKKDDLNLEGNKKIFGASGCCVLYRRKALDQSAVLGEYYDEDFFAYKEDADLSWRLQLNGWESWLIPSAVAYHRRSFAAAKDKKIKNVLRARKNISKSLKILSVQNHHLMIVKNDSLPNILRHFFPIIFREIKFLFAAVTFEPFLWKSFFNFLALLPKALKKRRIINLNIKIPTKEMRKWFV